MSSIFPKNLKTIQNMSKFREYCLKPKGLDVKQTSYTKKQRPYVKFVNHTYQLYRPEKPIESNTVCFKVDLDRQKPEIKQYLEKVYGLDVEKVHTLRTMGKIRRNHQQKLYREKDIKKTYVELSEDVDPYYQKIEQM